MDGTQGWRWSTLTDDVWNYPARCRGELCYADENRWGLTARPDYALTDEFLDAMEWWRHEWPRLLRNLLPRLSDEGDDVIRVPHCN